MPLNPNASMGQNISEIMDSFKKKGKIGNITPSSKSKAQKIAIAISYRQKGERK